jgi:hypothetical protein
METTASNKALNALRWIGFIPCAALGAWLTWIVMTILNRISMIMTGINPNGLICKFFIEVIASGCMGAAFVYIGSRVAPLKHKIVAYVLLIIAILISGFLLFPAISQQNWWAVISTLSMAGGAGLTIYSIIEEKV